MPRIPRYPPKPQDRLLELGRRVGLPLLKDIAQASGIPIVTISRTARGRTAPQADNAEKLAKALHVPVSVIDAIFPGSQ